MPKSRRNSNRGRARPASGVILRLLMMVGVACTVLAAVTGSGPNTPRVFASTFAVDTTWSGAMTVNGTITDWSNLTTDSTNPDWFGAMYQAGNPSKPVLGNAYLRFDCTNDIF